MPLLKTEAEKLTENDLIRGIVDEVVDHESLMSLLPYVKTEGKAFVYNREDTISEPEFLDPNENVTEEASTFTEVTTNLRVLIGDVDIDKFLSGTMSDVNSQAAVQLSQKAKGMGRKFKRTLVNGDNGTNAKEFDGVGQLVAAGQTFDAGTNGNPLTLEMLDELVDKVKNGADAIMMREGTLRAYRALLRASGGTTPEMIMLPNFGRPVPTHNGIPIIVNDFMPGDEVQGSSSVTASIYAMRLNEADGLHGLYGGGDGLGFAVENIGTVQNRDAVRWRVKWYCGLALKSTLSLARITGITNI